MTYMKKITKNNNENYMVSTFHTLFMFNGKKNNIIYYIKRVNFILKRKKGISIKLLLNYIINYYSLSIQLKKLKVAGNIYLIPFELTKRQQINRIFKEFKKIILGKRKSNLINKTIEESEQILKNSSNLIKRKEDIYKKAEDNTAFIHYKW